MQVITRAVIINSTGVCEKTLHFVRASALQSGRSRPPPPDLVLCKPIFPQVSFFGGVFFPRTPVS